MSLFTATLGWVTRTQKKLKQCTTELQQNVEVMRKADDDTIWKERVKFQVASETMDLHYTRAQEYLDKLEVIVADLENDDPDKLRMDAIREEAMDVMDASSQLQTEVKMKFRGIEIALSEKKKEATSKGQPATSTVTTTEELTTQQSTRMLPQIQIPTFSGKRWEFENFWTLFQTLIHQSSLVPLIKFTHLLNLLRGEPRTLISCYQLTAENYSKALATLEARYSNEEATIKDLSSKLQKAKLENPSLRAQRDLFCTLKVVLEQLESRKEQVDTQITREIVLNKFPASIKKEVIKKKLASKEAWTMTKLLADLEGVLIMEEELAAATQDDNQPKSHHQSDEHGRHQSPAAPSDNGFACVYCKKTGHSSKNCQEVTDVSRRTEILNNEMRCFNCTNTSHSVRECPSKRSCDVCNKRHHTSIHVHGNSEAVGGQQMTPTPLQSVTKGANTTSYTQKPKPSTQASLNVASTHESNGLQLTEAIQCKAATQARGSYLPTVQAQAFDHNSKVWGPISIMLDTGADRTYINKDLATAWDLEKTEEILLRIQTFGNEAPETAEQFQTCNLWLKAENDPIQMKVVSAPKLTGQIPKAALTEEDLKWIQSNQITLNEESHDEKVAPDLIIGCDYLPEISQSQLIRLPSGISLIHTIFGHTTLGKREDTYASLPPIETHETVLSSVNMASSGEDLYPHQTVITPQETATKCRVVLDDSAHFANGPSLNDAVLQGPVILPDSIGIVPNSSCGNTARISDVEKTFPPVFLHEEDRDVNRMLWVTDLTKPATGNTHPRNRPRFQSHHRWPPDFREVSRLSFSLVAFAITRAIITLFFLLGTKSSSSCEFNLQLFRPPEPTMPFQLSWYLQSLRIIGGTVSKPTGLTESHLGALIEGLQEGVAKRNLEERIQGEQEQKGEGRRVMSTQPIAQGNLPPFPQKRVSFTQLPKEQLSLATPFLKKPLRLPPFPKKPLHLPTFPKKPYCIPQLQKKSVSSRHHRKKPPTRIDPRKSLSGFATTAEPRREPIVELGRIIQILIEFPIFQRITLSFFFSMRRTLPPGV